MRQQLDKIFTFKMAGTAYVPLAHPSDYMVTAIRDFLSARLAPVIAEHKKASDADAAFPVVLVADQVCAAISELHSVLQSTTALFFVTKALFSRGEGEYVWKGRAFHTTLDSLMSSIEVGGKRAGGRASSFNATVPADLRLCYAKILLAVWCHCQVVEWRPDLAAPYTRSSILVKPYELPLLVAESQIAKLAFGHAPVMASTRVVIGTLQAYAEGVLKKLATGIADCVTLTHISGRASDIVAFAMRGGDIVATSSLFVPLASTVNFISAGPANAPQTLNDALLIGPHVAGVMKAIADHPDVVVRTPRAYMDMFAIKRIFAARTRRAVITFVSRVYPSTAASARLFDVIEEPELGLVSVMPATTPGTVPKLDEVVNSIGTLVSESLLEEALTSFSEGDAVRALMSVAPVEELEALAACIAGEVDFVAAHADPDADLTVHYVFRPDASVADWEDLVSQRLDGTMVTSDWDTVLRFAHPYVGSGAYVVADGLAELLVPNRPVLLTSKPAPTWLDGGKVYSISVQHPLFTYNSETGERVVGISPVKTLEMTPFLLMGMAPLKSHVMIFSPSLRARLSDAARLFAALYDLASGIVPTYIAHFSVPDGETYSLFGEDLAQPGADTAGDEGARMRRTAVLGHIQLLYREALIALLGSPVAREAYTQCVIRARGRAQRITTALEAQAYLSTVQSYLYKYMLFIIGAPVQLDEKLKELQATPEFERLASFAIRSKGGTR